VWGLGVPGDRAIALQASAPSPWGQFHDLRWLLVFNDSWLTLALGAVGLVCARSLLDTFVVRQLRPGRREFLRDALSEAAFTSAMLVLLLPWAVMGFGVGVVPISWLFFTSLPPVFAIALASGHGSATPQWWHRVPPRGAVAWTAATFAAASLGGLATESAPSWAWVPIAAAAGLFYARAWRGVVSAVARPRGRQRWVPLTPALGVGMLAVAVSGAAIAFAVVGSRRPPAPLAAAPASPPRRGSTAVLVASGFDSVLSAATPTPTFGLGPGFDAVRFSYRGVGAGGQPLDYGAADTHASLRHLARLMAAQVGSLYRSTDRPVDVVAESEGALVARVFLAAYPHAPVSRVVLLSPLDQPGRVYYPPGGGQGFGVATGRVLEGVTDLLAGISPIHLRADSPFLRSVVGEAPGLRGLLSCPTRPAEDLLEPLADALADPASPGPAVPAVVVAAFHGGLLTNPQAQRDVGLLLRGRRVAPDGALDAAETVLRGAAAGWQAPTLPLALYTASPDHPSCAAMTASIRRWVAPAA
jgi:hypothetical protein